MTAKLETKLRRTYLRLIRERHNGIVEFYTLHRHFERLNLRYYKQHRYYWNPIRDVEK